MVEERRGSARAKLYCVGRDIEYREISLERSDDNVWKLISDSLNRPKLLQDKIVLLISELLHEKDRFIGTPTELAEIIDPVGTENNNLNKNQSEEKEF